MNFFQFVGAMALGVILTLGFQYLQLTQPAQKPAVSHQPIQEQPACVYGANGEVLWSGRGKDC